MKKSIFLDVILSTENQPPFQNVSPPFACYLLQFFYTQHYIPELSHAYTLLIPVHHTCQSYCYIPVTFFYHMMAQNNRSKPCIQVKIYTHTHALSLSLCSWQLPTPQMNTALSTRIHHVCTWADGTFSVTIHGHITAIATKFRITLQTFPYFTVHYFCMKFIIHCDIQPSN